MIPDAFIDAGIRPDINAILGLTGIVIVIGIILGILRLRRALSDTTGLKWVGIASVSGIVLSILMLWPFDPKYHHVYAVTGIIESVHTSGGPVSKAGIPVVRLNNVPTDLVVNDYRIENSVGYRVDLMCNLEWHLEGDKFVCIVR